MAQYVRTKKCTDTTYSPDTTSSPRVDIDGSIQEAYDMLYSSAGADNVKSAGITGLLGGAVSTVFELLSALKSYADSILAQLQNVVLGQIPDRTLTYLKIVLGTITDAELMQTGNNILPNFNTHLADYVRQIGDGITTGTNTAYILTLAPALVAYTDGIKISIKVHTDCGASPTVNVNGLGAKSLKNQDGTSCVLGQLKSGIAYNFRYNGTDFILSNASFVTWDIVDETLFGVDIAQKDVLNLTNYKELEVSFDITPSSTTSRDLLIRINDDSSGGYISLYSMILNMTGSPTITGAVGSTSLALPYAAGYQGAGFSNTGTLRIDNTGVGNRRTVFFSYRSFEANNWRYYSGWGTLNSSAGVLINKLSFFLSADSIKAGSWIRVKGVK